MLPIYICEDEAYIRKYLVDSINKHVLIENYDMKIVCETENPNDIILALKKGQQAAYFLDIDLKNDQFNGFTLAKEIRKLDETGFIMFVTTHGELTFETFKLHLEAMDYIVKDQEDMHQRIINCIDAIQERLVAENNNMKAYYSVKTNDKLHHIPVEDILYFETSTNKHRLIVYTQQEMIEFPGSLNEVEKSLDKYFMRVHRSFLINCSRISKVHLSDNLVELVGGVQCPVARQHKKKLQSWSL